MFSYDKFTLHRLSCDKLVIQNCKEDSRLLQGSCWFVSDIVRKSQAYHEDMRSREHLDMWRWYRKLESSWQVSSCRCTLNCPTTWHSTTVINRSECNIYKLLSAAGLWASYELVRRNSWTCHNVVRKSATSPHIADKCVTSPRGSQQQLGNKSCWCHVAVMWMGLYTASVSLLHNSTQLFCSVV